MDSIGAPGSVFSIASRDGGEKEWKRQEKEGRERKKEREEQGEKHRGKNLNGHISPRRHTSSQ